jgi:hypothetical protein
MEDTGRLREGICIGVEVGCFSLLLLISLGCFGLISSEYLTGGKATTKSLCESGIKSSPSVWRVILAG